MWRGGVYVERCACGEVYMWRGGVYVERCACGEVCMWRGVHVERRCGGIEVWKCVTVEYGGVQEKQLGYRITSAFTIILYILVNKK